MTFSFGVLGGIGPETTAVFYKAIISRLQKSGCIAHNTDYPQILINSVPAPELTGLQVSPEDIQPYIEGVRQLAQHQPKFIVMACNTIHLYLDRIITETGYSSILSIRDLVYRRLIKKYHSRVCVLATPTTIHSGLYDFDNIANYKLQHDSLLELEATINQFSTTGDRIQTRHRLLRLVDKARDKGADLFILGCTEISLLLNDQPLNHLDTLSVLIDEVVQRVVTYSRLKRKSSRIYSQVA